jgi:hypothetical protein
MFSSGKRRTIYWRLLLFLAGVCAVVGLLGSMPKGGGSIGTAYGAVFVGSSILFSRPFMGRGRTFPHWMRIALWMIGPIGVSWSLLGFTLLFASDRLSVQTYHFLYYMDAVFEGMGLSVLLLLTLSGAFVNLSPHTSARKPPERDR